MVLDVYNRIVLTLFLLSRFITFHGVPFTNFHVIGCSSNYQLLTVQTQVQFQGREFVVKKVTLGQV